MTRPSVARRRVQAGAGYAWMACVVVSVIAAQGCLSSNDSPTRPVVTPDLDASPFDAASPSIDANVSFDAATPVDAAVPDAAISDDAAPPPVDAGPIDAGASTQSQVGLVGGGTSSRSAHYVLVGSTSPATAPVLHSANYGLTGGMAASAQKH